MKIGILEIPGMGKIKPIGFGLKRLDLLQKNSEHELVLVEAHYGHLLQYKSDKAFNDRFPKKPNKYFKPSDRAAYEMRKFMMSSLSDNLMYAGEYRESIDIIVYDQYMELKKHCDRILVIGHSLGSVLAYSLMHKLNILKDSTSIGLVTTGCPLIDFTYDKIGEFNEPWLNIWEYSDFVSNPIMRSFCQDYQWKSKKFIKGSTVKVHGTYNKSNKLAKLIAKKFLNGD